MPLQPAPSAGAVRLLLRTGDGWTGREIAGLAEPGTRGIMIVSSPAPGCEAVGAYLADAIEAELLRMEALPGSSPPHGADHLIETGAAALAWVDVHSSVMVALATGPEPWVDAGWQAPWVDDREARALPAMPLSLQPHATTVFPGRLGRVNAAFWTGDVSEIVPTVLARIGLALETPRIFISYRRHEAQGLADQLFEALAERNFDVFLDCFRLPPGVDFQRRLTQELGDKSVVLVLESAGILASQWTRYEIDTAKTHGLGLLALRLPGGVDVPSIDAGRRTPVADTEFDRPFGHDARLLPGSLARVVTAIVAEHDRALRRRMQLLRVSVAAALRDRDLRAVDMSGPFIGVQDSALQWRGHVWLCARPPALPDFHALGRHFPSAPGTPLAVVGLTALMEERRRMELAWLSGVSAYSLFDTSELSAFAGSL